MRVLKHTVTLLVFVLTFTAAATFATTRVVDNLGDDGANGWCSGTPNDCSLRGALAASIDGDIVTFDPVLFSTPQTIVVHSTIQLYRSIAPYGGVSVEINGPGANLLTIKNAPENPLGIFSFTSNIYNENVVNAVRDMTLEGAQSDAITVTDDALVSKTLVVERCVFRNNAGGIQFNNGSSIPLPAFLTVSDSEFYGNGTSIVTGRNAGAGRALIQRSYFHDNPGEVISGYAATIIDSCVFTNNHPPYQDIIRWHPTAGDAGESFLIKNSEISNNSVAGGASVLYNYSGIVHVENTTFSGNTTGGVGVYFGSQNTNLYLTNSTITNNNNGSPTANFNTSFYSFGAVILKNNIIAGNTGVYDVVANISMSDTVNNVVGRRSSDTNLFNGLNGNQVGTIANPIDPRLFPLASNGGTTRTHALMPNSPAIDRGSNPPLVVADQRGTVRPAGVGDVGAYQRSIVRNANSSGSGSLRQVIADACNGDTVTFDPAFFNVARSIPSGGSQITIPRNMTIEGTGSAMLTLDGQNTTRIIGNANNTVINLNNLRLTRGNAGGSVGGAISNDGTMTLTGVVVDSSTAATGGGFYNGRTANINYTTISGCTAASGGGAVANAGTLSAYGSTFSGNTATFGGALLAGPMSIFNNTTVSGNLATTNKAGGIYIGSTERFETTNATITDNVSNGNLTGGIYSDGGVYQSRNSIVAGNRNGGGGGAPDVAGSILSYGYNLIGSTAGNSFAANSPVLTGNRVNVAASLAPLDNYGGPTKTHIPLQSSVAINNGDPGNSVFFFDQRGASRTIGRQDIGAVEDVITFSPSTLPNAVLAAAYNQTLSGTRTSGLALGGELSESENQISDLYKGTGLVVERPAAPFTFSLLPTSGFALPSGLSLAASGTISGIAGSIGSATFNVLATDADGMASVRTYTITTVGNTPPTIASTTLPRVSGAPVINSTIANVTDLEDGNGTVAVAITNANPSNGVTVSNITNTGGVVTANVVAALGATNATFNLRATDSLGLIANATLTVNVTSNANPTISGATISRVVGTPATASTIATVADPESGAAGVTVTLTSANPSNGMTVSGITNTNGTVTAQVAAACGATTATFNLLGTDTYGGTTASILTVTAQANPAPGLGTYASQSGLPAANFTVVPSASPSDNGTFTLSASASAGFTGTLAVNQTTGTVTVTNAGPSGTHTITVTATDNCGAVSTANFTVNINALPTITPASPLTRIAGGAPSNSVIATVSDDLTAAGSIGVAATTIPAGITVTNLTNTNGTIFANVAAACGTAAGAKTIVLTASDGAGALKTANLTVNVTANAVPTLAYMTTPTLFAGSTISISPSTATDDLPGVTYSIINVSPALDVPPTVSVAGVISITNAGPLGTHTITVRATDACGLTTDAVLTVNVATSLVVTKTADTNDGLCDADCSLREALAISNTSTGTRSITFAPGVFATPATIALTGGEITVTGSGQISIVGPGADLLTITGQSASRVFYLNGTSTIISGVTITGGNGGGVFRPGESGGLLANGGSLVLDGVAVSGNSAGGNSGGILVTNGASVQIRGSAVSNNSAANCGGIQADDGTSLSVTNSTFSGNSSVNVASVGAALCSYGTTVLQHVTISGNTGRVGNSFGGGIYLGLGNLSMGNSIVAGNVTSSYNDIRKDGGTFQSLGYNVVGITINDSPGGLMPIGQPNVNHDWVGWSPAPVAASLAPFANYGGRTKSFALESNSIAVNNADPADVTTTDQRGAVRPVGGRSDIGAVERAISFAPATLPRAVKNEAYSQQISATRLVSFAAGERPDAVIAYNTAPGSTLPTGLTLSSTGLLSGIPTTAGNPAFTIEATDADGTKERKSYSLFVNTRPTITGASITRQSGFPSSNSTIATVADAETSGGSLVVALLGANPSNGVTVSNVVNTNGTIKADVAAAAGATNATFQLTVTDAAGESATGTLTVNITANVPPTISATTLTRQSGTPGSVSTIATVSDSVAGGGPASVLVSVTSANPSNGVTVSNIVNTNGTVTANVAAACGAANATFQLTATDTDGATAVATLTISVTANTPPTVVYPASTPVVPGGTISIAKTSAIDNGSIVSYAIVGVSPAMASAPTINASGLVSVTNAGPAGTHLITVRVTDDCGDWADTTLTVYVSGSLTVTKTADTNDGTCDTDCSLREAVAAAAAGDTIVFSPRFSTTQTITIATEIVIPRSMTISGPGATKLKITSNYASRIFSTNGNVAISGLTVANGNGSGSIASDFGGNISSNTGSLILDGVAVRDGFAGGGGGVRLAGGGTYIIRNSTVSNNYGANGGGIVFSNGGTLSIVNSTVTGNDTGNEGGGLLAFGGSLNIQSSTFVRNHANSVGGGIEVNDTAFTLGNSIVASNYADGGYGGDILAATAVVNSQGYNFVGDGYGCENMFAEISGNPVPNSNHDIVGYSPNPIDPRITPLGNYGGQTMTHALFSDSLAIDRGSNALASTLATDQRGASRVAGLSADIGAVETGAVMVVDLPSGSSNTAYDQTLVPNTEGVSYAISSGQLPAGLSLATAFAPTAAAAITGMPSSSGTFNFAMTGTSGMGTSTVSYRITILAPTAAGVSVSGRLQTADGRGIRGARVLIADQNGIVGSAITGAFGYFELTDIAAGRSYSLTVVSKQFRFSPQIVNVADAIADLTITAEP